MTYLQQNGSLMYQCVTLVGAFFKMVGSSE
jgi:hypothetical protein